MKWPEQTGIAFHAHGCYTLHRRPAADLPFALVNNTAQPNARSWTSGMSPSADADGPHPWPPDGDTTASFGSNLRPVADGSDGELCLAGTLLAEGIE